jgi:Zn-dependent protease with chaperone function
MHLSLILLVIGIVCCTRLVWLLPAQTQTNLWQRTLLTFLFSPLLLLTTAVAVLYMGTQGQMLGLPVGWIGYSLALVFLSYAAVSLLWAVGQAWRSIQQLHLHPRCTLNGLSGRVLDHTTPFAAQVGFWRSELVVSRGLLDTLSPEQLTAVLTHEQAHAHYRDTF